MDKKLPDLDYYKRNISLPEFLIENYGYKVADRSSAKSVRLKSESGRTLVISRNSKGNYTFFDVGDDRKKGCSILDFLKEELMKEHPNGYEPKMKAITELLDEYIKNDRIVTPDISQFYLTNNLLSEDYIYNEAKKLKAIESHPFLESRGLQKEILQSEVFKDIFKLRVYSFEGKVYDNPCVIMSREKNKYAGLSERAEGFKKLEGSRFDSLAISNHNQEKPVDVYFIAESMIDCASHYQLNYQNLKNKNVVYFSTEGSLVDGQIATLQKSINHIRPKEICSLFDRDYAGLIYGLKLSGKIFNPEDANTYYSKVEVYLNKDENLVSFELTFTENPEKPTNELIHNLKDILSQDRITNYIEDPKKEVEIELLSHTSDTKVYQVTLPYNAQCLMAMQDFITQSRYQNNFISVDRPISNDFNDDLRIKNGTHPYWSVDQENSKILFKNVQGKILSRTLSKEEMIKIQPVQKSKGINLNI